MIPKTQADLFQIRYKINNESLTNGLMSKCTDYLGLNPDLYQLDLICNAADHQKIKLDFGK